MTETHHERVEPLRRRAARRARSASRCPASRCGSTTPSGEILVRGPNVFPGYWRRDEATRAAFTDDGWFRTGDVGALDADGYLRIVGRAKELIISGGFNVYPREVEDVLLEHPAVAEVAVVGEPSDEWGEVVVAVVVPATDEHDRRRAARVRGRAPRAVQAAAAACATSTRSRATRWARCVAQL